MMSDVNRLPHWEAREVSKSTVSYQINACLYFVSQTAPPLRCTVLPSVRFLMDTTLRYFVSSSHSDGRLLFRAVILLPSGHTGFRIFKSAQATEQARLFSSGIKSHSGNSDASH